MTTQAVTLVLQDRATHAISRREFTDNGYLRVPGRVARTGVQYYLAHELQLTDRAPNDRVGVYRPPEEVFSSDSLASYADVDVTIEHPGDMVDATTYKRHSVGHVTDAAAQDGEYVEAPLIIKDVDAIKEVEAGRVELSAGYLAEYVPEKGTTDAGESYEFVQRNIRINHVALVSRARAGHEARLYDQKPQEAAMTHQVTLDGASLEVADKSTATLIQDKFDSLLKRVGDAEKAQQTAEAQRDTLDEEKSKLQAKVSDEAIAERVKSVFDAQSDARKLAGDKFECDSLDPLTIKRAALKTVRDSVAWDEKPDAYVEAAWDMAMEAKSKEEMEEDEKKRKSKDSLSQFGKDMKDAKPADDAKSTIDSAYDSYMERKRKAHQPEVK